MRSQESSVNKVRFDIYQNDHLLGKKNEIVGRMNSHGTYKSSEPA